MEEYFSITDSDRSVSNGPLPNPRLVSTMVHRDESHDTDQFTMFVMQVGANYYSNTLYNFCCSGGSLWTTISPPPRKQGNDR